MTGYESKKAAARDKLLDDDDTQVYQDHDDALTIAYQSGFYDGKKAAAQEPTKYSFKAHWEADGCIGVVAAIERSDGGVHLLKDTIDAPKPAQEPDEWFGGWRVQDFHDACKKPAQEPIGYAVPTFDFDNSVIKKVHYSGTVPLYTTPPQRKPLTDEDLDLICEKALFCRISFQQFARSIEAAHGIKEKNT
jgi:hypothetical protein